MEFSDDAIRNLRRLWVSPQIKDLKLAMMMSKDALMLHDYLMPECVLALEFHLDLTTRLDIEDFLKKLVYGIELKEWREKIEFFHPPHQAFLFRKYENSIELFEPYFLSQSHLFEKYKEAAIHCSYSWGMEDKLKIGLHLFGKILEQEPHVGDHYFFIGRCHQYIYELNHDYGSTLAIKAYRKALRIKTQYRRQIKMELETLSI